VSGSERESERSLAEEVHSEQIVEVLEANEEDFRMKLEESVVKRRTERIA
jgi:epoxyqueuosine reductase QueG